MRVMIDQSVIGVPFVYDTVSRSLSRDVVADVDWHLDGKTSVRIDKSLDDLAAVNGRTFDLVPPRRFVDAYDSLGESRPPWADVLPNHVLKPFIRTVATQINDVLGSVDVGYHGRVFVPSNRFLSSMPRACIDVARFASRAGFAGVDSFRPDAGGLAAPVVYDRFGTRTGRLTVRSGPQILTLAKEHRDVLTSRYPGGRVVLFDYVSFEAQVALVLAGRQPMADVYTAIRRDVFSGSVTRDVTKRAVLGFLYGMGPLSLQHTLGTSIDETRACLDGLASFFASDRPLSEVAKAARIRDDAVINLFGRVVSLPRDAHRLTLNTLVQSTAADAALMGFAAVNEHIITDRVEAVPIFVIHDGVVIDCAPSALDRLDELAHVATSIPGLVGQFPVCVKELCN